MTPELKARWLKALETYPKTKGHLKDNTGYCCLGVLIDIAGPGFADADDSNTTRLDGEVVCYAAKSDGCGDIDSGNELSNYGRELFGLSNTAHDDLANINDASDTFTEVMEYICKEQLDVDF